MQLARFLNKLFKKGGFILVDANSKKYIIYGYNIYVGFTNFISGTFEYFSDNTFQRSKNE